MADKIVIGLTGNIATGKSLVLRMLQELGATTVDADKLVHQLMRQGGSVYQAIVEEFGKFILDEKGEISRPRLGNIVFNDPDGLAKLEALTHPGVRQEIQQLIANAPTQVVAVEAIKLFESGLAEQCDSTWVVVAAPNTQLERLTGRRKLTPDQAKQRIKAQSSQQEKAAKANIVIDNSGALAKTWTIVKKHYTELLQAKSGAAQPEVEAPVVTPAPVPLDEINPDEVIIRRAKREDLSRMAELIATGTKGALQPDLSAMMEDLFS